MYFKGVLDAIYPRACLFCSKPNEMGYICNDCFHHLFFESENSRCSICGSESMAPEKPGYVCFNCLQHRPAYDRVVVMTRYELAVRDLIHLFKYHHGYWLKDDLIRLLFVAYQMAYKEQGVAVDLVIPVPMMHSKHMERGYNQAAVLAKGVAKMAGLSYSERWLKRVPTGVRSQTELHRSERLANAKETYRLSLWARLHKRDLAGKRILLIDDVMTTGATMEICASLLKEAGAKAVYGLVIARPISV